MTSWYKRVDLLSQGLAMINSPCLCIAWREADTHMLYIESVAKNWSAHVLLRNCSSFIALENN
jgi:hypothetical protein